MDRNCENQEEIIKNMLEKRKRIEILKMELEEVSKDINQMEIIRNIIIDYIMTHAKNYYES